LILINYSLCFGLPWEKKPALGKRFHDPEKSRQLNGISFADQDRLLFGRIRIRVKVMRFRNLTGTHGYLVFVLLVVSLDKAVCLN
jgi:hypothetical protein